jgi:hypothetical protein
LPTSQVKTFGHNPLRVFQSLSRLGSTKHFVDKSLVQTGDKSGPPPKFIFN